MTANLKVTTDVKSYRTQVERYARLTGVSLKEAMQEGVSVMAGQLVKRFPPKSKSVGLRAIKNDLSKIIKTQSGGIDYTKNQLQDALDFSGDDRYDPNGIRIQEWHESNRKDNDKGRMRPRSIRQTDRLQNGWRASAKLHTTPQAVKKYARRRGLQVGKTKSHWAKATQMWKGAAKIPSWVSRHGARGRVIDRMKRNGDGYIEISNDLPYSSNWTDINNFVVKSQGRMFKNRIRGVLKKRAREFNAK